MAPTTGPSLFQTDEVRLTDVWAQLKAGRLKVVGAESTESDHTLTLSYSELNVDEAPAHDLRIFERTALLGYQRVAIDMGVAVSSVANAAKEATRWLGFLGMPSRIPPLLAFSVLAAHRGSDRTVAREYRQHLVLSLPRAEALLGSSFGANELAILRLLVEGNSLLEIAGKRGMAGRVTANQVVRLYKKLGVSGRSELLALVFALPHASV